MKNKRRFSRLYAFHFLQFTVRCIFFLTAAVLYIRARIKGSDEPFGEEGGLPFFWGILWLVLFTEMIFRLMPTKEAGIGCQKQFKHNFLPTDDTVPKPVTSRERIIFLGIVWIGGNLIIGALYLTKIIDAGIMVLLSLAYGVGDLICLLFFCPFRDWFLKNRCCTDCAIYNWDFPMMFTPYIFLPHPYTWSLLGIALVILGIWEINRHIHPERFAENTNANLSCKMCKDKPCRHAKRLSRKNKKQKLIH